MCLQPLQSFIVFFPLLICRSNRRPSTYVRSEERRVGNECRYYCARLYIKKGENIRVRLINAGSEDHFLHLHGHDFWLVCDDGIPVPYPWQMNTLRMSPGKTFDIIIEGKNRGIWTFHDHDTRRVTNNGLYPGGNLMALVYEDLPMEERMVGDKKGMKMKTGKMNMLPKIALDE